MAIPTGIVTDSPAARDNDEIMNDLLREQIREMKIHNFILNEGLNTQLDLESLRNDPSFSATG